MSILTFLFGAIMNASLYVAMVTTYFHIMLIPLWRVRCCLVVTLIGCTGIGNGHL